MKTFYKTTILLAFISLAQFIHAEFVSSNIPNDLLKSRAVAMGDVNNDGNLDIYVGNKLEQNKLWLGNGDGTFSSSDIPGDDSGNTTDVVMADFNNDGNIDIYVSDWYMKNKLWLGNGDGTFIDGTFSAEVDGGASAFGGIDVGDIDNDGDLDIYLVPRMGSTSNTLWLNDGNADFTLATTIPKDGNPTYDDVVMADFDSDGNLDIYQSSGEYNRQNKLWMGNGEGTFTNNDISDDFCLDPNGGCPGRSVTAGDIDNDGDIDLYLTAYYDYSDMNLNKFWINDGSANFIAQTITDDYGYTALDSQLVDIDSDGDLDILIAMYYNRQNIIWLNDGTGNFIQDNIVGDTGHSFALVTGDVNNDGALDIYIGNGDYGIDDNRLWLQDTQAPVITLNGNVTISLYLNETYTEEGAICNDNYDNLCLVSTSGSVDTSAVGTYIIYYDAMDSSRNQAIQVTRTIEVKKKPSRSGSKRVSKAKLDKIFGSLEAEGETAITDIALETEVIVNTSDANNGICEASLFLTQNLKSGAQNGRYHSYTNEVVTEVKILQTHMNRLGFNAGIVDGILGPITESAIKRMQVSLGTIADGYVGPITKSLINKSC